GLRAKSAWLCPNLSRGEGRNPSAKQGQLHFPEVQICCRSCVGDIMKTGRFARVLIVTVLVSTALLVFTPISHAADLVCTNQAITISSPTTYDNVTVQNGCVLTVD